MGKLMVVEIAKIRENPVALRTVDRQGEGFIGLMASIKNKGFFGAISVRENKDKQTGEAYFELIDGLHRFLACKDLGLKEINVDVMSWNDAQVLEGQLMANTHKIETRPAEYSKQLKRILSMNPLLTATELANNLGKSVQWLDDRLNIARISNKDIRDLIDSGKIKLSNAAALAKLPENEQPDWVDRAITTPPDEFIANVTKRVKEVKEAQRQGKDPAAEVFQAAAHARNMKPIKEEAGLATGVPGGEVGKLLCTKYKVKDAQAGFKMALLWVCHMDPESIAAQKTQFDETRKARDAAKAKRAQERADKKAVDAKKLSDEAAQLAAKATEVAKK